MKTAAQFQKEYRERYRERHERMRAALVAIVERLTTNDKPLAVELRRIAQDGLGG